MKLLTFLFEIFKEVYSNLKFGNENKKIKKRSVDLMLYAHLTITLYIWITFVSKVDDIKLDKIFSVNI